MAYKQVFFALVALMAFAGTAAAGLENGALTFANVSVSPNPVIAGENATIRFQLYNSYDYWVYNVNLQPTGGYPLLNVSPLSARSLGTVNPGFNGNYLDYTLFIPATTPSGVYALTFTATYYALASLGVDVATSSMPLSLYVQNKPAIAVVASSAQPAALYSGYNQTVQLAIENTGYGTARNVSVAISAEPGLSILSSVKTFPISNLTRGSAVSEPILVSAANAGSATLDATITYYSSTLSQRFSSTQRINLSVAPAAQFSISTDGSAKAEPGATDVPVRFVITNTGTSEAEQVQLSLQSSYPITPVASTAYIADLPAGASANTTFLVSIDSQGVPGNYPITVYEQWKQPNGAVNQQFSGSNNYFITVYGSSSGGVLLYAAAAAVIVAAAVVIYFRRTIGKKRK